MKLTNLLIQTFLPDLPRDTSDYSISKKKKKKICIFLFVCLPGGSLKAVKYSILKFGKS